VAAGAAWRQYRQRGGGATPESIIGQGFDFDVASPSDCSFSSMGLSIPAQETRKMRSQTAKQTKPAKHKLIHRHPIGRKQKRN
jgi:hypothetical protein